MERAVCLALEQLPPRAGLCFPPKVMDTAVPRSVSENENAAPEKQRLADGMGKVVNHVG